MPLDNGNRAIHINNGVFLIRNTDWSRSFISEVISKFSTYKADGTPEQDAMRDVMYSGKDGKDWVRHRGSGNYLDALLQERVAVVEQRIMDSFHREKPEDGWHDAAWKNGDFIAHVSELPKERRMAHLKDLTDLAAGQVLLDNQIAAQFAEFDHLRGYEIKRRLDRLHQSDRQYYLKIHISNSLIQVVDGLYISEPNRRDGVISLLERVKARYGTLPDVDLVVYLKDEPQVQVAAANAAPVFAFERAPGYLEIPFPYPPTFVDLQSRVSSMQRGSFWPWGYKIDKLVWRGSQTGGRYTKSNWRTFPRSQLVLACRASPNWCDAGFSSWTQVDPGAQFDMHTVLGGLSSYVSEEQMQEWRYIASVDGNGWADRLARILASSSLVMKQDSEHVEFWYVLLRPLVHYVPLEHFLGNLKDQITWARNNPVKVQAIIKRANNLVKWHLSDAQVDRYIYKLLTTLALYENR